MATFNFETITAAQALAVTADDQLTVMSGTASAVTIIYDPDGHITMTLGARTIEFGAALSTISQKGQMAFADGSALYIGDGGDNSFGADQNPHDNAEFGGAGNDSLTANGPHALIQGNAGNDLLQSFAQSSTIYGGQGDDTISVIGSSDHNFLQGNKGDDQITGGHDSDIVLGGQGNDTIAGGDGSGDYVDGNLGNDFIVLAGDHGTGLGEDGNDQLFVSASGFDTVDGGPGDDRITVDGSGGNAVIGGDGDDSITADSPANTISAGAGNDFIRLNGSQEFVDGDDGDDHFVIVGGRDTVHGNAGNDTFEIQGAPSVLFGGTGSDLFVIETDASRAGSAPSERISIQDWTSEDHIHLQPIDITKMTYGEATVHDETAAVSDFNLQPNAILAVQIGTEVLVLFQPNSAMGTEAIVLAGRTLADIDASNFI